jgi:thiol-disulfide isomerase/thioredoxin
MKMREKLLNILVFLCLPTLAICKDFIKPSNPYTYTSVNYSELISENFLLRNGHGEVVNHSALKDKYVIVFFTAKWCGPCKMYGNFIKKFLDKHTDKLRVVMISLDRSDKDLKQYSSYYDNKFYYLDYSHREMSEIWELTAKIKTRKKGSIPVIVMYNEQRELIGFPRTHIQLDILSETREVKKPFNPWN